MSTSYSTEPATQGSAVLNTTIGPLEITFFANEAPRAVTKFLKLIEDGYYNSKDVNIISGDGNDEVLRYQRNVFVSRVIPGYLVQLGGPRGCQYKSVGNAANNSTTNNRVALEEQYFSSKSLKDDISSRYNPLEFDMKSEKHSRIKFNHRGQIAFSRRNVDDVKPSDVESDKSMGFGEIFITLGDSGQTLDKAGYTIFGSVSGTTI